MFSKSRFIYRVVHYIDVIMTTRASQITSLTVVYSTVYSDADQSKHQSSASLAFVWGIHRDRWIPRTKGQLRGKCFHLMTSSWFATPTRHASLTLQITTMSVYMSISANQLEVIDNISTFILKTNWMFHFTRISRADVLFDRIVQHT